MMLFSKIEKEKNALTMFSFLYQTK